MIAIRRGPAKHDADADPLIEAFLACHHRVRRFTRLAIDLAGVTAAPPAEVAEAAAAVERYFRLAMPLHAEDEDISLLPRLEAARPDTPVLLALERMTREHQAIEGQVAELLVDWVAVAGDPGRRDRRADALAGGAGRLNSLLQPHLQTEEDLIFPAARRLLSRDARAEILQEMQARRRA